jgi:hypothetical protein
VAGTRPRDRCARGVPELGSGAFLEPCHDAPLDLARRESGILPPQSLAHQILTGREQIEGQSESLLGLLVASHAGHCTLSEARSTAPGRLSAPSDCDKGKVVQIEQKLTPAQSPAVALNSLAWAESIWSDVLS